MGLRDFLQNVQSVDQVSQNYAQSAQRLRQQTAQNDFENQAPDLLANPSQTNLNQLALQAYKAGDSSLLGQQYTTAGKLQAKKLGLDDDELSGNSYEPEDIQKSFPGISADTAKSLADSDMTDKELFDAAMKMTKADNRPDEADKMQQKMDMLDAKQTYTQRNQFSNTFDKFNDQVNKETNSLQSALDDFKSGNNTIGDTTALQTLVKHLTGSTRPLSPQAAAQYLAPTLGGDLQKASNFVQSGNVSILSPDQRTALQQKLQSAIDNEDQYKKTHIGEFLSNAAGTYPNLFKGGAPDKAVTLRAQKAGLKPIVDEAGNTSFQSTPTKTSIAAMPGEGNDGLQALAAKIGQIKDAKRKSQAADALKTYNKKAISPSDPKFIGLSQGVDAQLAKEAQGQ